MKKYIIILFSILLLASSLTDAQINPIKRPKQKPKTEQRQSRGRAVHLSKTRQTISRRSKLTRIKVLQAITHPQVNLSAIEIGSKLFLLKGLIRLSGN